MRRAIMESGPCIGAGAPAAEAAGIAASKMIMEKMKITSLKAMRSAKALDIVAGTEGSNVGTQAIQAIM